MSGVSVRGSKKMGFIQFYVSMKIYFHRIINMKINIVNWEWMYLFLPYDFFIETSISKLHVRCNCRDVLWKVMC
jgi:ABC-type multidrug transport system permease subunit